MAEHALFAPSAAYAWLQCLKYLTYDGGESTNAAAEFGTKVHKQLEAAFLRIQNGEGVQRSIHVYARKALQYVFKYEFDEYWPELRVIDAEYPDLFFGTVDFIGINRKKRELLVFDLKTGNYPVSVINNPQLMIYAGLALIQLGLPKNYTVRLGVIQPSRDHYVTDVMGYRQIMDFIDICYERISLWLSKDHAIRGNPEKKACQFCPLRHTCTEYLEEKL